MKKNETGFPISSPSAPCLNTPRTNDEGKKQNENGTNLGETRPREGCSGSNNRASQIEDRSIGGNTCDEVPLAYVYAPVQKFCMLYTAEEALKHGTLFENLYKPMEVYGNE